MLPPLFPALARSLNIRVSSKFWYVCICPEKSVVQVPRMGGVNVRAGYGAEIGMR